MKAIGLSESYVMPSWDLRPGHLITEMHEQMIITPGLKKLNLLAYFQSSFNKSELWIVKKTSKGVFFSCFVK